MTASLKRWKFHSVIPQSLSLGLLNLIFVSSRVRKQTNLGHGENKIFTFNRQDAVGLKQFGPSPFTIFIIIAIRIVSNIFLCVFKENPVPRSHQGATKYFDKLYLWSSWDIHVQCGLLKGKPSLRRTLTGLRISIICKHSGTGVKTIKATFQFLTKSLIKDQKKYKGSYSWKCTSLEFMIFLLDKNQIQSPQLVTKRSKTKKC